MTANAICSFLLVAGRSTTLPMFASVVPLGMVHVLDEDETAFMERPVRLVPPTSTAVAPASHATSLSTETLIAVGVAQATALRTATSPKSVGSARMAPR
jgi:hypothetical protein